MFGGIQKSFLEIRLRGAIRMLSLRRLLWWELRVVIVSQFEKSFSWHILNVVRATHSEIVSVVYLTSFPGGTT